MLNLGFNEFIMGTLKSVGFFGSAMVGGYAYWHGRKLRSTKFLDELHQTVEDRSCSTLIIGLQGSGKTYLAMEQFLDDIDEGYGALWLSTQGIHNSDLLNYIPKKRVEKTILLRPYAKKLRGINLLRRYTKTQMERTMIADSVITLFTRLFNDIGDNMKSILQASTLALLEYSDIVGEEVCLWDLYVFFTDAVFRSKVANTIENDVIGDMLEELDEKSSKASLKAILRRFRTMLYNDNMVAFLSQKKDDVDLLRAVKKRKIIICDFYGGGSGTEGIGKENSYFLAELIVTKFQLIAESRYINDSLYPLYLDEFQTYTSTAKNIADFIDLNRQRRMPPTLICQRRWQLGKDLKDAVDGCGTKYILKLNANDLDHFRKAYDKYSDKLNKDMPRRAGIYDILSYGKTRDRWVDKTEDIRPKAMFGHIIEKNNEGKHTVAELIKTMKDTSISKSKKVDMNDFQ